MAKFALISIEIMPACKPYLKKVLCESKYEFMKEYADSFYGNTINLHAIVGMNGSGKSTLLELVFRMINNFSAGLFCLDNCPTAEELFAVKGLYATLTYMINGKEHVLECRDAASAITFDGKKYRVGMNSHVLFPDYFDADKNSIQDISNHFFYTIVSNYSIQAYNVFDYQKEVCVRFDRKQKKWMPAPGKMWMNSLFHKNDGYMCPININPYRDNGVIDMNVESSLLKYRMASILLACQRTNLEYLQGYTLNSINFSFDIHKIIDDYPSTNVRESDLEKLNRLLDVFKHTTKIKNSFAQIILNCYRISNDLKTNSRWVWIASFYLVKKVLQIGSRYPAYREFRSISNIENVYGVCDTKEKCALCRRLVKKIKADGSHISFKVQQCVHFINTIRKEHDCSYLDKTFSYECYEKLLCDVKISNSLYWQFLYFPPAFFNIKIYLNKIINGKGKKTVFEALSSGERQFVHMTSSIVYHLLNLRSIEDSLPRYENFNIVLDEVELCFHPEYQRLFVNNLLTLLKRLGFSEYGHINIMLTTHSPFILSDMIHTSILYLSEGRIATPSILNPFAANVNDILKQGFFLHDGFIGEYARRRIRRTLNFLTLDNGDREQYDLSLARDVINRIGDPVIKKKMEQFFRQYIHRHPEILSDEEKQRRIAELQYQIDVLQGEKNA